jgi:hypothetical protein
VSDQPRFPFVVGCGRSGTTLVRALLDAHPDLAVPDESYFPVWFARKRHRYELDGRFALERFLDDLLAHEQFARWGLDPDAVRAALTASAPASYPDAIRACFRLYAQRHGKTRYGDKTPVFVMHIPLLAQLFPEAVFVHVIRDGRDVALSRTEASWGTVRLDHEALLWRSQVEQGHADGVRLGGARYREIRYEDLLDDPERIARELCAFVDIDFDPSMLRYHERAAPLVDTLAIPQEHQNLLRPPTKGLRDWRSQLSPADAARFEALAGRTLRRFGYERTTEAVPVATRARALRDRGRYAAVTRYRSARSAVWHALHPNVQA